LKNQASSQFLTTCAGALGLLCLVPEIAAWSAARSFGVHEISLAPARLPRAVHWLDYGAELSASGGLAPYAFALTGGALPAGVALTAGGSLAGVPDAPGAASFTVTATDADGCSASASFVLPVMRGFRPPDGQVELPVPVAGSGGTGDPAFDRTTSTLEVSGILEDAIAVIEADVYVTLRHERTGDLLLTLVAPDGTRTRLAALRGGAGQDYEGTCFRADAADAICDGAAPFHGEYRPEQPTQLEHPNGTWALEIDDTVPGATGTLLDWSLALETAMAGQRTGRKFVWYQNQVEPPTNISASETDLYVSSEAGTVRRIETVSLASVWTRSLIGGAARSLYVDRSFGVPLVAVASASGLAFGLDAADGSTLWSLDLGRPTCSADGLGVPPLVQLWGRSDCAFRSAVPGDLIFFGTDYACSTTTANRVIALNSATGSVRWTFNATGSFQMDRVTGMVGDPTRNRIFAVSAKGDPFRTQSTVWGLSSITGTKLWSVDLGDVAVAPVLAPDGLFVLSRSGTLAKLDPDTGAARWTLVLGGGTTTFEGELALDGNARLLFAVDSAGDLHAVSDLDVAGELLWTWGPTPVNELLRHVVVLPHREWVVASSTAGRFHQVNKLTGVPALFGQALGGASARMQLDDPPGNGRVECRLMMWSPTRIVRAFTPWTSSDLDDDYGFDLQVPPTVRLRLQGTTSPRIAPAGGIVTDVLEVTSKVPVFGWDGVRVAEGVTVTATLPARASLAGVDAAGTYSLVGQELVIRLGTLQIGQSATVRVMLLARPTGDFVRTYTVWSDRTDADPVDDSVTLENRVVKFHRAP